MTTETYKKTLLTVYVHSCALEDQESKKKIITINIFIWTCVIYIWMWH